MKREEIHIRDPFVFAENGTYYLLGTTTDDPWGAGSDLTLYSSADLGEFKKERVMVTDGSLASYTNIWTPELHKYNGKYYLIVSAYRKDLNRGCFIFVSDSLEHDFKMITGKYITPAGWNCLDATLFVNAGIPYLCFSNDWTTPVTNDGDGSLYMAELKADLTEIIGQPKKIISGKYSGYAIKIGVDPVRGYVAEGPWLYTESGKIVLLWSTIGKDGYMVIKSVSDNGVFGDYEFERVIFHEDGGHCMRFVGSDGKSYIVLHQPNQTPHERMKLFLTDSV